ncbi:unnamed protein product, partial [Iphiclides podalirius]
MHERIHSYGTASGGALDNFARRTPDEKNSTDITAHNSKTLKGRDRIVNNAVANCIVGIFAAAEQTVGAITLQDYRSALHTPRRLAEERNNICSTLPVKTTRMA